MRHGLAPEDLAGLLERPLVAVLVTFRPNGGALLSPVWHEWRDGGFTVWTGGDDVKVRHLRRDPRAAMALFESELPYRGIEVRGRAEIVSVGVRQAAERIANRYLGPDRANAYLAENSEGVLIRLGPGELRSWDFADEFGDARRQ